MDCSDSINFHTFSNKVEQSRLQKVSNKSLLVKQKNVLKKIKQKKKGH